MSHLSKTAEKHFKSLGNLVKKCVFLLLLNQMVLVSYFGSKAPKLPVAQGSLELREMINDLCFQAMKAEMTTHASSSLFLIMTQFP